MNPEPCRPWHLAFAVGTRGADHNRSGAYEVDFSEQVDRRNATLAQARLAVETEKQSGHHGLTHPFCKFLRGVFEDYFAETAAMLNLVTGWGLDSADMLHSAESVVQAKKEFNIACGWTPVEDTLPSRMLTSALEDDHKASLTSDTLNSLIRL